MDEWVGYEILANEIGSQSQRALSAYWARGLGKLDENEVRVISAASCPFHTHRWIILLYIQTEISPQAPQASLG